MTAAATSRMDGARSLAIAGSSMSLSWIGSKATSGLSSGGANDSAACRSAPCDWRGSRVLPSRSSSGISSSPYSQTMRICWVTLLRVTPRCSARALAADAGQVADDDRERRRSRREPGADALQRFLGGIHAGQLDAPAGQQQGQALAQAHVGADQQSARQIGARDPACACRRSPSAAALRTRSWLRGRVRNPRRCARPSGRRCACRSPAPGRCRRTGAWSRHRPG